MVAIMNNVLLIVLVAVWVGYELLFLHNAKCFWLAIIPILCSA